MQDALKERLFANQEEFIATITEVLGTSEYENLILNYLESQKDKVFKVTDSVNIDAFQPMRKQIADDLNQLQKQSYSDIEELYSALRHISLPGLKDLVVHYAKLKHGEIFRIRQEWIFRVEQKFKGNFNLLSTLNIRTYSGREELLSSIEELALPPTFKKFVLDRLSQKLEIFTVSPKILLRLKEHLPADLSRSLASLSPNSGYSTKNELIKHLSSLIGTIRFKSLILEYTQKRRPLILFDGLDEVSKENGLRKNIIQELRGFNQNYRNCQVVITCRVAAHDYFFSNFTYVEIADFNNKQVENFITKWFAKTPKKGKHFFTEFNRNSYNRRLYELARNPLLLTLLCIAFQETLSFPARRAEIYEEALDALLKKWDASRGIKREEIYQNLSVGRKRQMFAKIAITTFEEKEYLFSKKRLGMLITEYLRSLPKNDGISLQDMKTFSIPELPFNLREEIIRLLSSLPNVHDNNALRALIYNAGLDEQLQTQITFSLPPIQFFQIHVPLIYKYGLLTDGRNPIKAVLESAKAYVGQQGREHCSTLIHQLDSILNNTYTNPQHMNKLDIDSDAIIEEIEAQHGIFIERAQNIYSFSHLTFQEYYTAKYITDDVTCDALKTSIDLYFDQESWREVFLLTAEMLANADAFFNISIDKINDHILQFEQLRWLLHKLRIISGAFSLRTRPFITRLAFWGLITNAALDIIKYVKKTDPLLADKLIIVDWKSRDDYEKVRALSIALHIASTQTLNEWCNKVTDIEYLDVAIAKAGFYTIKRMISESNIFFQDSLFGLNDVPSKMAPSEEWRRFTAYMLTAVKRKYGKNIDSIGLTKSQYNCIRDYMKNTKLLLDCLDVAYVTDLNMIESKLLLP